MTVFGILKVTSVLLRLAMGFGASLDLQDCQQRIGQLYAVSLPLLSSGALCRFQKAGHLVCFLIVLTLTPLSHTHFQLPLNKLT